MPEASPASFGSTSLIAASSTGLNAIPAPTPSRIIAREDVDDEAAVDRGAGEEEQPDGGEREPDAERDPDSVPHHELRGEPDARGRP